MSSISSSESSSDDSDSDSEIGGRNGSLTASGWNRQKMLRPIRPRQKATSGDGKEEHRNNFRASLVKRRHYPIPDLIRENDRDIETDNHHEKNQLQQTVLMDCLSTHFLWSHLPRNELELLCDKYLIPVKYRNREIIYSRGDDAEFLYILYSGEVVTRDCEDEQLDEKSQQQQQRDQNKYTILGELALLTSSPYHETAQAASNCTLFRLHRVQFHRSLARKIIPQLDTEERISLLKQSVPDELAEFFTDDDLAQLSASMTTHSFEKEDVLVDKKTQLKSLVIIFEGTVTAKDTSLGGRSYEDQTFGPNEPKMCFGWQSLLSSADSHQSTSFKGNIVCQSEGIALLLSKSSFIKVMAKNHRNDKINNSKILEQLAARRLARIELQGMPVFKDSLLDESQINKLVDLMHRFEYISTEKDGETTIFNAGDKVEAALYFVREGSVTLKMNKGRDCKVVESGDFWGESDMLRDQNKDGRKHFVIRSPMAAVATGIRTVVDVLYLEECRAIINTTLIGLGKVEDPKKRSACHIQWADIKRHALLGTGTFGQVWLASIPKQSPVDGISESINALSTNEHFERQIVALKVQSKYQVIEAGEAGRVVAERNILASLTSPFLLRLYHSFQDESLLYMITSVAQGGELDSLIPDDGLPESSAKFYAAGILEGLASMHRCHLIHRDIKPANVLINEKGYPELIDFGFAKYVPENKTFTFVGSPIFTAPEIIRQTGHNRCADYWSWGVLVYRLVTGKYPFYEDGIDELELYRRICKGSIELNGQMSVDFRMLMVSLLYPNPDQRLGSGKNGWRDIFSSPWFAKDDEFDIYKLSMQKMPAPWVPDLKDPLDASSFHPDESEMEDLLRQRFPMISEKSQQIFACFGPNIE